MSHSKNRVVRFKVNLLVLRVAPQPLDEHIVAPAPCAIHVDLNIRRLEDICEGHAAELVAPDGA